MIKLFLAFVLGCSSLSADDFIQRKFESQCLSGNPLGIEKYCASYLHAQINWDKVIAGENDRVLEEEKISSMCYMYHFAGEMRRQGVSVLDLLKDRNFTQWLLDNPRIFEELVFSNGIHKRSLDALNRIWLLENGSLDDTRLTMALGCSLLHARQEWDKCLERYLFYRDSLEKGRLLPPFKSLAAWEMGILFAARENVEDLKWGQDYIADKPQMNEANAGRVALGFIPYREKNRQGISVHQGGAFYDYKPICLSVYVEYGGVCGAVSKGACGFLSAKGIPAYTIGQPGHCAFVWKNDKGQWVIGNNIYGWNYSTGGSSVPWKGSTTFLYSLSAFQEEKQHKLSNLCYYLSFLPQKQEHILGMVEKALTYSSHNIPAWKKYLELKMLRATETERILFAEQAAQKTGNNPHELKFLLSPLFTSKEKNRLGYRYCAFFLTKDESPASLNYFMREYWPLAKTRFSTLKKLPDYTHKNEKVFFKNINDYFKKNTPPQNMCLQVCQLMEQTVSELTKHEKTCHLFLDHYFTFLKTWNNKALYKRADEFANKFAGQVENPVVKKHLLSFCHKIAQETKDLRKMKVYSELSSQ